jgi:hypothetical protein
MCSEVPAVPGAARSCILRAAMLLAACAVLIAVAFLGVARAAQPNFRPVTTPLPPGRDAIISQIPHYKREAVATYLTFPEWYLVFAPQEYGEYLKARPPSGFPYFRLIHEMWWGYAQVYAISRSYPFDGGDNLMIVVISTSSTFEFGIKGAYEETVGRLFEAISGYHTPEDAFAARVAVEYGDFVPSEPWFDYPYAHRLKSLWVDVPFFGPNFPRKIERRIFLSTEYGIKALYAGIIRLASHAVYGVADTEVMASARGVNHAVLSDTRARKVRDLGQDTWILALPHYQGFTDDAPELAKEGMDLDEVAGNREILATFIAPKDWEYNLADGRLLFSMPLLNTPDFKRLAVQAPVSSLGGMLREAQAKGLRVEHLFDY